MIFNSEEHIDLVIISHLGKAIAILKPGEGVNKGENTIVKCEYTIAKKDLIGFIRYYLPSQLAKRREKNRSDK